MKFFIIEGNRQRLDGGAMFGNAPKELWQKWKHPDEKNRINLACRALLVQDDQGRNLLFETGIGVAYEPKFLDRYGVFEKDHELLKNLKSIGVSPEHIDAVILSHLHFDHAGGLLRFGENHELTLAFPKARIYVGKNHWQRAQNPHYRDRASFLPALHKLFKESGRLQLVAQNQNTDLFPLVDFRFSEGHTPGLMHALINIGNHKKLVFASDLIPGLPWIHLPITMGYDRYPEKLIEEKKKLLNEVYKNGDYLFLTHDDEVPCAQVHQDEKGRFFGKADLSLFERA